MSDHPHKFLTLDAMRGVAAMVVVEFHAASFFGYRSARHGYLAVDFFFLLSGFVLSLAYQNRLDAGWSTRQFFKVRVIRLYPLYLLGTGLALGVALLAFTYGASLREIRTCATFLMLALCMVPMPTSFPAAMGAAYPLNFPAWSLFLEMITNLVHALGLRRRGWLFLSCAAAVCGVLVLCSVKFEGTVDFGLTTKQIFFAIPRAMFSYIVGLVLFKLWTLKRFRIRVPFILPPAILIAVLLVPEAAHLATRYDLFVIACIFPLLLWVSAATPPPAGWVTTARLLGRSSYALYVLHIPMLQLQQYAWQKVLRRSTVLDRPWSAVVYCVMVVAVALLVDRLYDEPVRAFLRDKFSRSPERLPIVTPNSNTV